MGFQFEPTLWLGAVRAVIPVLILFGFIQWSDEQIAAVVVALEVVLTLFQRSIVTPNAKLAPVVLAEAKAMTSDSPKAGSVQV